MSRNPGRPGQSKLLRRHPSRIGHARQLVYLAALLLVWLQLAGPLAAEEPIHLVFAEQLTPLSYDDQGTTRGILVDVAIDVLRDQLGLPIKVGTYPWERAQQMVRQGEADGFITISTAERREYADCGTLPVLRASLHPLLRQDHKSLATIAEAGSLEDLRSYNFISYFGNGWARENLEKAGFDVFFAADYTSHIKGLAQGRGDLALVTPTSGAYYIRQLGLEQKLTMLPLVLDTFEYVLCLGKQSPYRDRLADFESALGRKRNDGSYLAVLEYYGLQPGTPY
jgi:polar amino acid transport system substrate-binding protein